MDRICITSFTCLYDLQQSTVLPCSCHYNFLTTTANLTLSAVPQLMPLGGYRELLGKPLRGETQQFEQNTEWDSAAGWTITTLFFSPVCIRTAFTPCTETRPHCKQTPDSNNQNKGKKQNNIYTGHTWTYNRSGKGPALANRLTTIGHSHTFTPHSASQHMPVRIK
jgi:hypothetical protein